MVRGNGEDLVLQPSDWDKFICLACLGGYTTVYWQPETRIRVQILKNI